MFYVIVYKQLSEYSFFMTKIPHDPSFTLEALPPEISTKLQRQVQGEVLVDVASRGRYATDASIYQQFPIAVLIPKSAEDIG